jgi:hypothetical protein
MSTPYDAMIASNTQSNMKIITLLNIPSLFFINTKSFCIITDKSHSVY